jgi:outer membrane receptor for ferrienterochelin and colicins
MKVLHESLGKIETTPNFYVFDIGVISDINIIAGIDSNLKIGVKNITNAYQDDLDIGVHRDPGYVYGPTLPRAIYADVSLAL